MSEPLRFRDDDGMLGAAFRAADDDAPPAHAEKALLVALGAGTVIGTTKATAVSTVFARVASFLANASLTTKAIVVTTIVATGSAGVAVEHHAPSPQLRTLEVPHKVSHQQVAKTTIVTPTVVTTLSATPAPHSAVTRPPPAKPRVREEIAELDAARVALALGRAQEAVADLERYRTRHPSGVMTEEARVLEIEALAKKGDIERAHALGNTFLNERPSSPLAARVRRVLAQ